MNELEIRIECLKLVNRHDLDPKVLVERAKVFEAYVVSQASDVTSAKASPPKQPSGTQETEPKDSGKDSRRSARR